MKIKQIKLVKFKRFSDLTISEIPKTTKLVVLVGPNGCGKSSLFEAFNFWNKYWGYGRWHSDQEKYYAKAGLEQHMVAFLLYRCLRTEAECFGCHVPCGQNHRCNMGSYRRSLCG